MLVAPSDLFLVMLVHFLISGAGWLTAMFMLLDTPRPHITAGVEVVNYKNHAAIIKLIKLCNH